MYPLGLATAPGPVGCAAPRDPRGVDGLPRAGRPALELDLCALGLAGVESGVAGGSDAAPYLDLLAGPGGRGREEQRHPVGRESGLLAAVRVLDAGVEGRRRRRVDELILRVAVE